MSRPMTPAGSLQSRYPSTQLDTTSAQASAVTRQRSSSTASRDLLDHAINDKTDPKFMDPKTRREWTKFSQLVDRTLQSFDSVSEWADFITFLGKLLKCLQAYPSFSDIPHKLVVAKRLAQCLNPALPTGVHQRALDVYVHILGSLGPGNLRRDLQLWSSGLFPFFQFAATSIRPIVLGIYSKFYIPLQDALRPATKALILALLPGLEEETGEFFERVSSLLDQLSGTVSPSFFLQNIWLVLITAPSLRIAALNYLSKRMPKIGPQDSIVGIVGDDVGLMVRGFSAALLDSQPLVQRAVLDLVLVTLPISGSGFQHDTRREERLLLVQSMSTVVLRRDLSLSRRLYSWLLGPSEDSAEQMAHLRLHGLDLLAEGLVSDIVEQENSSTDALERQRPYKTMLSLLDKWEIGFPLTEVIALDLLRSLMRLSDAGDLPDELHLTAVTLFESLDPFVIWRQLYHAIRGQLTQQTDASADALDILAFVIHTFRFNEDEIIKLHAPLSAFACIDLVRSNGGIAEADSVLALNIAQALLRDTSPTFFSTSEKEDTQTMNEYCGLSIASNFYAATDNKFATLPPSGFAQRLLRNALSGLLDLACKSLATSSKSNQASACLSVLAYLTEQIPQDRPTAVEWQPETWLADILQSTVANAEASPFALVESSIQTIIALNGAPLNPPLLLDRRHAVEALVELTLRYLQPEQSAHHVQAVALIWALDDLSKYKHVEAAICKRLAAQDWQIKQAACVAFGNLWRYTDDSLRPAMRLTIPMRMMLDSLRSEQLSTRRMGEAWMRCSVKSYLRILEPLLHILLDPRVQRLSTSLKIGGREVKIEQTLQAYDAAQHHHALQNILSLATFGGQAFTRLAKSTSIRQSFDKVLIGRLEKAGLGDANYLDALTNVLVKTLKSQSDSVAGSVTGSAEAASDQRIHAISSDLLQSLLSRGELDISSLQDIRDALITRIFICIHSGRLDLQNKLLHVLHATVAALAVSRKRRDRRSTIGEVFSATPKPSLDIPIDNKVPTMLELLRDGLTEQKIADSALLHHWVDFLLMTLPHLRTALNTLLLPLIERLSARVETFIDGMEIVYDAEKKGKGRRHSSDVNEADFAILLNALERLFVVALEEARASNTQEDETTLQERPQTADSHTGGFLGYISTALGTADAAAGQADSKPKAKAAMNTRLSTFLRLLLRAWCAASRLEIQCDADDGLSQGYTTAHVKARTKKAFERMYKTHLVDVLDSMCEMWHENTAGLPQTVSAASDVASSIFEMLDHLAPNAQSVVSSVTELMSAAFASDKGKAAASPLSRQESLYLGFLEAYLATREPAAVVPMWTTLLNFSKELLAHPTVHKYRLLPTLRCLTTSAEKLAQTPALEDRRMRRDLHETFVKLVDATVQASGRSSGGLSQPPPTTSASTASLVSLTSEPNGHGTEKLESSILSEKGALKQDSSNELALFLAERVVPDFRHFRIDNDKLAATCSNIMYYQVSPSFKTRGRTFDVDESVLLLLGELTKVPAAFKAWRATVLEVFSDNRFFSGPPSTAAAWRPIVQALLASDKERFADMIAKVSAATSANIFVNRELESLSKAISIRRFSYTIFCGEKNRYLVQLPAIQEKVVELLRAQVSDLVHSEVYLCLRVLLCRIGNQHLSSFWPIILTELLRLFEGLMHDATAQSTEYLQLVLSACKFLDLLLVLQTEEFQIHQWMFITDTVDAVYPPESWSPQATMDRLGEIVSQRLDLNKVGSATPRISLSAATAGFTPAAGTAGSARRTDKLLSRPLLGGVRQSKVSSLSQLEPFFSRASLSNYEAVYALGGVDWPSVERSLELDLFEGEAVA